MNEEVEVKDEVQEQEPAEVSGGLSAGFNKVRGITDAAEERPAEETPPTEVEAEPTPEPEPLSQEELRAMVAKMPELEQFRGSTASELQKLHGKIGEFNRTLLNLQSAPTAANSEAHKTALAKLTDEYPELAETLAPLFEGRSGGGISSEQVKQMVDEGIGQATAKTKETIEQLQAQLALSEEHPDWRKLPATPEYKAWFQTKPKEFQDQFNSSWDIGFVAKSLTEFKSWKSTTYAKAQEKRSRLEGAVTPSGVPNRGQARLPDNAGLSAGFNRVRRSA